MKTTIFAACVVALGLAGCAPTLAGSNAACGVITHALPKGDALRLADQHCHQYGKVARISSEDILNTSMNFDCVAP